MKKSEDSSDKIAGLTRLAMVIADHFQILCSKQDIHHWRSRNPPFPSPNAANRFDKRACFDWIEANIMTKRPSGEESQMLLAAAFKAKQEQIIRENEEHKFKFDVEKKKYVERSLAERSIVGMSKKIFSWVRGEIERSATSDRKAKLIELGASPELAAAFYDFDLLHAQKMIDAISATADKNAQEATDGLST